MSGSEKGKFVIQKVCFRITLVCHVGADVCPMPPVFKVIQSSDNTLKS